VGEKYRAPSFSLPNRFLPFWSAESTFPLRASPPALFALVLGTGAFPAAGRTVGTLIGTA